MEARSANTQPSAVSICASEQLIGHHQLAVAMLDRFARHIHARLRGEYEAVAETFRTRQAFARFFGRVFRGDRLLRAEGDDADIPLALFFRNETSKRADGVFADNVRRRAMILRPSAAPEIHDISRATFFHER